MVEESDPDAANVLYRAISGLLDNTDFAREVGSNAAGLGFPCAADDIAAVIYHSLGAKQEKRPDESPDETPEREPVGAA